MMPDIFRSHWFVLCVCTGAYLLLILPTVAVHGVSNDELIDMTVAMTYLHEPWGWLIGSDLDGSQTRLPMYLTAIANFLLGTESLIVSRVLAVCYGALACLGVYVFCVRHLSRETAVIAAGLLAISPYFLAFTRVAMTEGAALEALAVLGVVWSVTELGRHPNVGTAALAALACGLLVSAKITTAPLVLAAIIAFWILQRRSPRARVEPVVYCLLIPVVIGLALVVTGWLRPAPDSIYVLDRPYQVQNVAYRIWHIAGPGLTLAVFAAWAWKWRSKPTGFLASAAILGCSSLLVFFVIPPVHTTNPFIMQALARMAAAQGEVPDNLVYSAFVFHLMVILFKSGVAAGVVYIAAILSGLWFARSRPVLSMLVLFVIAYIGFNVYLARAQTFYMIAIMPLLAILAGDMLQRVRGRRPVLFAGIAAIVLGNTAVDIGLSYPDMHLNGYQYLGKRYIAHRSTLGYKGVVQTPSDGTKQVIDWTLDNIEPDKRVVTYLRERMVNRFLGLKSRTGFHTRNGFDGRYGIDEADYVLVHINATLRQFDSSRIPLAAEERSDLNDLGGGPAPETVHIYPFDVGKLERDFEKVFSVRRAFDIEVASVWKRR